MKTRRWLVLLPVLCLAAGGLARAADAPPDDARQQLSQVQGELATALRSYSILQDENATLKDQVARNAADLDAARRSVAELTAQAAAANQVDVLRTQLRQTQEQLASLAADNAALRLRLAVVGPPPSGSAKVPTRPADR